MRKSVTVTIILLYLVAIIVTGFFACINSPPTGSSGGNEIAPADNYFITNYEIVADVGEDNVIGI